MSKKATVGVLFWLCVLAIITISISLSPARKRLSKISNYFLTSPHSIQLESTNLEVGGKVISSKDHTYSFVGYVKKSSIVNGKRVVTLVIDPEQPAITKNSSFEVQKAKGNMDWALKTILPEYKIKKIKSIVKDFQSKNKEDIRDCSMMVAGEVQSLSSQLFQENFPKSYKKHEEEFTKILDKHSQNMKKTMMPVLKEELGEKAKEELKPLLILVGKELWDALPFWSFTWRVVVDKLPYTKQDRTEKMFEKFLEEKAIPILSTHEEDFVKAVEKLTIEAAKNKNIRKEFAVMAKNLFEDKEFQEVIKKMMNECLIDPFEFESLVKSLKKNKKLIEKFDNLQKKFDPYLKEITRIVIKSEEGKIDENLVIAIRRVFFEKGQRIVVYFHKDGPAIENKYIFKSLDKKNMLYFYEKKR